MICEKLPETKGEIIDQLEKQKLSGLIETAIFLIGVEKYGQWNEQKVTKEYMIRIKPFIIEILDQLKDRNSKCKIR